MRVTKNLLFWCRGLEIMGPYLTLLYIGYTGDLLLYCEMGNIHHTGEENLSLPSIYKERFYKSSLRKESNTSTPPIRLHGVVLN
jgi:hypothetical protein